MHENIKGRLNRKIKKNKVKGKTQNSNMNESIKQRITKQGKNTEIE